MERKKTELEYLNAFIITDFIDLPMHIIDSEGLLVHVNNAWTRTYHLPREEVVGKSIQDVMKDNLKYFLFVKDEYVTMSNDTFYGYEQVHQGATQSIALRVLEEKRKLSMVSYEPSGSKVVVTSTPIFDEDQSIRYVFTYVQSLENISNFKDQLEAEIEKNKILQQKLQYFSNQFANSQIIGVSKKTTQIKKLIQTVSKTDASILILGESGVGKEVIAKEIYDTSLRKDKPFVTINCAAIPENLLESEMFGYEKGAFTGAARSKEGLFEIAEGGTILLDEIGAMPLSLQPKLLRVLQENEFRRVGGVKRIPLNIRIISATNENLLDQIKKGHFRQDLYYRLNVIPIVIPPLRERREDINVLSIKFLDEFNEKYHKKKVFNEMSLIELEQYSWPGNVRELKNAIERLVIIGETNVISAKQVRYITDHNLESDPAATFDEVEEGLSLKEAVSNLERKLISDALYKYKTTYKAAEALGTTQPTIVRKAKQLGITKNWNN